MRPLTVLVFATLASLFFFTPSPSAEAEVPEPCVSTLDTERLKLAADAFADTTETFYYRADPNAHQRAWPTWSDRRVTDHLVTGTCDDSRVRETLRNTFAEKPLLLTAAANLFRETIVTAQAESRRFTEATQRAMVQDLRNFSAEMQQPVPAHHVAAWQGYAECFAIWRAQNPHVQGSQNPCTSGPFSVATEPDVQFRMRRYAEGGRPLLTAIAEAAEAYADALQDRAPHKPELKPAAPPTYDAYIRGNLPSQVH